MEKADINILRDKAYQCAVRHGWHTVEKPDSHWLMMIITEVSEAIQADRLDNHTMMDEYKRIIDGAVLNNTLSSITDFPRWRQISFDKLVKNTVEDELSDIIIRCYDLAGLRDIDLSDYKDIDIPTSEGELENILMGGFSSFMFHVTRLLTAVVQRSQLKGNLKLVIWWISEYAGYKHINLDWHIREKMRYNESRPYKHDKNY